MRLIGKSELYALARTKNTDLLDAVLALGAELEAASWRTTEDVRQAYPQARLAGHRLTIDLDGRHYVLVAFNLKVGIALVETAGLSTNQKRKRSAT